MLETATDIPWGEGRFTSDLDFVTCAVSGTYSAPTATPLHLWATTTVPDTVSTNLMYLGL